MCGMYGGIRKAFKKCKEDCSTEIENLTEANKWKGGPNIIRSFTHVIMAIDSLAPREGKRKG